MFDINTLAVDETAFMQFRGGRNELVVNDEKQPVGVRFYTPGSATYQAVLDKHQQDLIDERAETGEAKLTAIKMRERQTALLAGVTIGFEGFTFDQPAADFWGEPKFFALREQFAKRLDNTVSFMPGSATS